MKFNCGPSYLEKETIRQNEEKKRIAELSQWHSYFALFPTRVGPNECRWLETIERKGTCQPISTLDRLRGVRPIWNWQYRVKEDENG